MKRSEYISPEERVRRDKRGERRFLILTISPMVLILIAWVSSNLLQIRWLQYVSLSFIALYLLAFIVTFTYGMLKLSDRSI